MYEQVLSNIPISHSFLYWVILLIVVPQLRPVILSSSIFQAILAFQAFGPIFTLTDGGPGNDVVVGRSDWTVGTSDTLYGGNGDDTVVGGSGSDVPLERSPLFGEHTREVLAAELGLSDPEIDALIQRGAARG